MALIPSVESYRHLQSRNTEAALVVEAYEFVCLPGK